MKYILNIVSLIALVTFMSCDGNESPKQDATTAMLTASSWGSPTVAHSDGDLSDQYENFIIAFTSKATSGYNGTFIIANGGNAFSETSGLWKFNPGKTQIILDSEKEIDFFVTENSLQLEFTVTVPNGKTAGLTGHFVFELSPL
jgi:hypothetical protein